MRGIADSPPKLIVTAGDVRGIGREVIADALSVPDVRRWAEFTVLGPTEKELPRGTDPRDIPAETAGRWAGEAIEEAVAMILRGEADALVTAPIEKRALVAGGYPWPGHTEFLAHLAGVGRVTMMLAGGLLRVALVTSHLPFDEIRNRVTPGSLEETVAQTIEGLGRWFGLSTPRIAVCGLNPHAGEGGVLGREEMEIVAPVVARFREASADVTGPYPADTIFGRAAAGEFDAVVALYHDQGLGPLKIHAFGRGVNVTLGLPFIRTSPDHGTAFDIAGRGIADSRSMIHAIRTAAVAARRGKDFDNGRGIC